MALEAHENVTSGREPPILETSGSLPGGEQLRLRRRAERSGPQDPTVCRSTRAWQVGSRTNLVGAREGSEWSRYLVYDSGRGGAGSNQS